MTLRRTRLSRFPQIRNTDFNELVALCEPTHPDMQFRAARSVDVALVARNWLLGRHILTYEQNATDRAQYGDRLIGRLATSLRIKGVSATNLRKIRQFYCEYPIQQTLSVESDSAALEQSNTEALAATLAKKFPLSWSHYVSLLSCVISPIRPAVLELSDRSISQSDRSAATHFN